MLEKITVYNYEKKSFKVIRSYDVGNNMGCLFLKHTVVLRFYNLRCLI